MKNFSRLLLRIFSPILLAAWHLGQDLEHFLSGRHKRSMKLNQIVKLNLKWIERGLVLILRLTLPAIPQMSLLCSLLLCLTAYNILFLHRTGSALMYGCWVRITETGRQVLVCVNALPILHFEKASENVTWFRNVRLTGKGRNMSQPQHFQPKCSKRKCSLHILHIHICMSRHLFESFYWHRSGWTLSHLDRGDILHHRCPDPSSMARF